MVRWCQVWQTERKWEDSRHGLQTQARRCLCPGVPRVGCYQRLGHKSSWSRNRNLVQHRGSSRGVRACHAGGGRWVARSRPSSSLLLRSAQAVLLLLDIPSVGPRHLFWLRVSTATTDGLRNRSFRQAVKSRSQVSVQEFATTISMGVCARKLTQTPCVAKQEHTRSSGGSLTAAVAALDGRVASNVAKWKNTLTLLAGESSSFSPLQRQPSQQASS